MVDVDLHLHTTFSDGRLSPTDVVKLCARRGLKVIAVTDHDSTKGIEEALAAGADFPGLSIIPGVELSTDAAGNEVHLLGYFVDHRDETLQSKLLSLRGGREERAREIVEKLNELGLEISWSRVEELSAGGAIGRPHIAQAMVEKGIVEYPREAFDRYLGRDGVAYVGRVKLTPEQAIRDLADHGAIPVMAHPTYFAPDGEAGWLTGLKQALPQFKAAGLVGIEVYYGDYTADQVASLKGTCEEFGLVPCGGSDYHASGNPDEPEPGSVGPPMSTVDTLMALKRQLPKAR